MIQYQLVIIFKNPYFTFSIHANRTEYGFGQSILNDNQLVFHTPPYTFLPLLLTGSYTGSLSKKMRAKVNRSITLSGVKQGKEISCGNLNLKYKQDTIVKTPEMDRGDSSNRRFSYSCNRYEIHHIPLKTFNKFMYL